MSNYYVLSLVDVDTKASYILKKPTSDITDEDWAVLKGKYEATLGSTSYTFDFKQGDTKGEGSFTVTIGTKNCAYTYKYENETGKLLTSIAIDGNDPLSTFTLSVKNATITLSDGSNSVNLTEKKNDINEILKGTYTASFDNSGNGEYEYEITFNDNGTATLKNKNKKRERICSYTYNEETGQLKFTKISGSSSSVGIESKIYVIDGQLTYKGPVMGGSPVFSRNGGNETPDVVEVPEEYIGTWYGIDSYDNSLITVELSATTVKVTSGAVTQTFDVQTVKDGTITAGMVTLVLGNNSISYNYSNGFVTCTLSKENPLLGVSTELQGTYEGINPDSSENVTIEVGEKTVKYDGFTYTISSVENGTYKFVDKTAPNFFVLLVVGADQKITFTTDLNATFEIHLKGSSTVVEIDESLQGTWKDETNNITLVISASSVNWNDIECTGVAYSEGNLSFTYNDAEYVGGITTTNKLEIRTGTTEWYTFSKQTTFDDSSDSTVSVLEDYQGSYSYYDEDCYATTYLVIASNLVLYNGDEYNVKIAGVDGDSYTITASFMRGQKEVSISVAITNSSAIVDELTYTKQAKVEILSDFVGKWVSGEYNYIVKDYAVYSCTAEQEFIFIILSCNENKLIITDGNEQITLTLNSDGTLSDSIGDTYTKQVD